MKVALCGICLLVIDLFLSIIKDEEIWLRVILHITGSFFQSLFGQHLYRYLMCPLNHLKKHFNVTSQLSLKFYSQVFPGATVCNNWFCYDLFFLLFYDRTKRYLSILLLCFKQYTFCDILLKHLLWIATVSFVLSPGNWFHSSINWRQMFNRCFTCSDTYV